MPVLEDSRSHDLTFWHWAASGKCRRLLPGDVLSLEEKGTGLGSAFAGNRMFMDYSALFLLRSPNKSMRR